MSLLMPNIGENFMLSLLLNKMSPDDLDIRLYTNDHTPTETDTQASYTEASGNGYASIQLVPTSWVLTNGNPTTAVHTQVIYAFTGGIGNVYGYYVTRRSTGILAWAERFSNGPYNIQNNGDEIRLTPRISLE